MRIQLVASVALIATCATSVTARSPSKARAPAPLMPASPLYSFLPRAPGNVAGLLAQLNDSERLRERYANHYHLPEAEVMTFFRQKLVDKVVPATREYTVWYSTPDGKKHAVRRTLKKGTRILALADGTPIIHVNCGNPFTSRLPTVQRRLAKVPKSKVKPSTETRRRYVAMVTPFEGETGFLAEMPYEVPLTLPFADVPFSIVRHRTFIPFWWGSHNHPDIPEPGTLGLLALGSLAAVGVSRRRR